MPKFEHQKCKLLVLLDLLRRETDEHHGLTTQELLDGLARCGIRAERKSVYTDLAALEDYGIDIVRTRDTTTRYALAHRTFELPELKLLVDAVQSSRFLSAKKSRALIAKLEGLASRWEAQSLQRQVYVTGRVKSMNESVYYNIDALHTAIFADSQIEFRYFQWGVDKKMEFRRGGAAYHISPYALMREDDNYYVIGYEEESDSQRHYRVDKMHGIAVLNTPRTGKTLFEHFDIAQYAASHPGMYGGVAEAVELLCANRLAGIVLDRFGREVTLWHVDDAHFKVVVRTAPSPVFFGWVAGFGAEAKITAPASVAESFAKMCREAAAQYDL